MREKNESSLPRLKQEVRNPALLQRVRGPATEVTRERGGTWPVVIRGRVRGQQVALQKAGNTFCTALGEGGRGVTAGAARQARQKVPPAVFGHLNAVTCEEESPRHGAADEVGLWPGWRGRGRGGEGRSLNLPAPDETRREVSVQTKHPAGGEQGPAGASGLDERRHERGRAALGPQQAEQNGIVWDTSGGDTARGRARVGASVCGLEGEGAAAGGAVSLGDGLSPSEFSGGQGLLGCLRSDARRHP